MLRGLALTLFSASTALAAVKTSELRELIRENDAAIPGAFIVELSSSPTKRVEDVHADFLGELDARATGKFSTRKKYKSPLFNGIAVQLHNPEDLASLASIPNIVAVRPIKVFQAPKTVSRRILSGPNDPNAIPFGQSTHYMTGVDHVHEQGIAGKGIKIGIIDSGVDYLHPSLGGAFGPGSKVAGGYDFVGDDYDGYETLPVPDNDPRDTCFGHGTHVAGVIGANPGNDHNITGVAYEATLLAYRVFSCLSASTDDILTEAMLRAYSDGADIVTMSFGAPDGWASSTLSVVASRVAEMGRVVTVSAGNYGEGGAMLFSAPAAGESVIAVGSVENIMVTRPTLVSSVEHSPMPYEDALWDRKPGLPLPVGESPFSVLPLWKDPDDNGMACNPIDEDLSQWAVVVRASTKCGVAKQIQNLQPAKPGLVLIYDTKEFMLPGGYFPCVWLANKEDGAFLVSEAAKGTVTVRFPQHNFTDVPNPDNGGLASTFSSYGPSSELLLKPALSAPGGNITSTYPIDLGSWAVDSGTSFSCPYVAGAAALVLQVKGKAASKSMRSILQSTSRAVPSSNDNGALAQTLAQIGAGLINVYNALNVQTEVSPAVLLLNDTAHWQGSHEITIKNAGKSAQTYELAHVPALTLISLDSTANYWYHPNIKQADAPVGIRLNVSRVTIPAGGSATVLATITPPKGVDAKLLPIVSGWVTASGSLGDIVKVSYMGVGGSMLDAQSISTGNNQLAYDEGGVPAVIPMDDDEVHPQRGPRNYTLDKLPVFAFMMAQASRHVTLDLIDAKSNISSTIPDPLDLASRHNKRAFNWSEWLPGAKSAAPPLPTVGAVAEWRDMSRGSIYAPGVPWTTVDFPTHFANGTTVPFGQYKLMLRALHIGGNPDTPAHWDIYVSQQVGLIKG
ncbi:subtilisin-like protein [Auricularia subglabra TFB-10046 SS5]|uniref:Subtilisin-like protein n=1 Tax=Auricularia subglabra (strain TFB-10046 / SS5) TaxID=717982 RepID=J0DDN2_AURST|nr:subtilisin-like protein [Auricularia subglabra TFB-10046 SS5]